MGNICKVIYFDEDSITDYLQISEGGELTKTRELFTQMEQQMGAEAKVSGQLGFGGLFKAIMGWGAKLSAGGSSQMSFDDGKMVKNILKNTILTDFLDIVEGNENDSTTMINQSICKFKGYKISAVKDSMSYMIMVSPYLSMLKSDSLVTSGEISIELEKIDKALRMAKGYYEFTGKKGKTEIVLRFNINAFRNGYTISDLLKMDLTMYAIKVGHTQLEDLSFSHEFQLDDTKETSENPAYEDKAIKKKNERSKKMIVYDVLLAGVESDGQ